jgi:hypothetical protein
MATLTPDLTKVTVAWAGVNTDGTPALGRLIVRYRGAVMLDDGTVPISIYPQKIEKVLTASTQAGVSVGYVTFDLPATNDPDVFGSGGVYVVQEDLDSGEGVTRAGIVDIAATGTVWLNRFSVLQGEVQPLPAYDAPTGELVTQDYSDEARRFVPVGSRLMILGGTVAQKPTWALPGDLYAAVNG